MLAVMKLGAVIMPTTTAVGPADLNDRIERSDARFVVCNPGDVDKFVEVPGDYVVLTTDHLGAAYGLDVGPTEHPGTAPTDRLLLYFSSGTTSRPKLVEHTQVSYPVGHLSTMYWLGLQPGDVHLNISSPGWAKHAWSCFFAPSIAEATVFVYNYKGFDAAELLEQLRSGNVTSFCAPPTVWRMLINADLSGGPGSLRELVGAGEPLNPEVIEQVKSLGTHHPRRIWPDRDHRPDRKHHGLDGAAGLDGSAATRRARSPGRPTDEPGRRRVRRT